MVGRAVPSALIAALALAMRYAAASRGGDNVDSIYFARALDHYSLATLSPYFPGFPLYVGAARLARLLVVDRYLALHLVSALASALAAWPLALIAADWRAWAGGTANEARRSAWAAALLWAVFPVACLTGTEIASEPLALLVGLVMLWCSGRVVQGRGCCGTWPFATGLSAGLMLGVRLFHVFLMGPAVAAAGMAWRRSAPVAVRAGVVLGLVAGIAPWLGWQVWHEGGALAEAGSAQIRLHLSMPEHSLMSDPAPLRRLSDFAAGLYVNGLGGVTPRAPGLAARALLTLALGGLVVAGARRLGAAPRGVRLLPVLFALPFALYIVAGQEVTYARYTLPLAATAILVAALGAGARGGTIALAVAVAGGTGATLALAREHRTLEPTEFQLARALGRRHASRAALLVVENQGMVTTVVSTHAPGVRPVWVAREQISRQTAVLEAEGLAVYSTMPADDEPNRWTPLERFTRRGDFDLHSAPEIWLFRHVREGDLSPAPR